MTKKYHTFKFLKDSIEKIPNLAEKFPEFAEKIKDHIYQEKIEELEKKLQETELKQKLIARLLSANNQNKGVTDYFEALNHDFLEFTNHEIFSNDAVNLLKLQEIGEELKVVGAYPEFYKKRTIAIAGGFSAGKSEFISSLFTDSSVRLPIGIEPTTAIPTYVFNNNTKGLLAYSQNGGVIDLLALDKDFQQKLTHHFIRSFGFNLKKIMPFIFLTTPIPFEHLCLIDTPGYNPSDIDGGYTSEDIKTASEFIHNSEVLLWLIGVDSNGTIATSDLNFLDKIRQKSPNKPFYLILNKADIRPYNELKDVMKEIMKMLDDYDIDVVGISAYSSLAKKEYLYEKKSLFEFLNELNTPSDNHTLLIQRLYEVDKEYQSAILRKVKNNNQIIKKLNHLQLTLLKEDFDDMTSEPHQKIDHLKKIHNNHQKETLLNHLEGVIKKMVQAIDTVFGQPNQIKRPIIKEPD